MLSAFTNAMFGRAGSTRQGTFAELGRRIMATPVARSGSKTMRQGMARLLEIRRAFMLVKESSPGWTAAYFIVIVTQSVLPLAVLYSFRLIVDQITAIAKGGAQAEQIKKLWLFIAISAAANVVMLLFRSLSNVVTEAQAQQVTDHLQGVLHSKSVSVDLQYYENDQYQDTLHRAQQEVAFRPTRVVQSAAQILQNALSLLAVSFFLLVSLPWMLCAVLLAASIPGILSRVAHSRKLFHWQSRHTASERKIDYYNWMLTGPNYAKEVRLFDLGGLFRERFRELKSKLRQERLSLSARRSLSEFVSQSSATLAVFGCFAYVAYRATQGLVSLGALVMLYQAFQRGLGFLSDFLAGLAGLYENNLFLTNLYRFLDLKEKVTEAAMPCKFPSSICGGIRFENVGFSYPGLGFSILDQVSFEIKAGQMVALVGQNGAGKSTIIKLLCRLYDPTEGRITIDGIDIREFSKNALRKNISVVFQDFAHYYVPAAENIWLGSSEQKANQEAIEAAARDADVHERMLRLPDGYATVLGKVFEGGEELSIGEWQRVALARAFLRKAPIVILDEPSSALDVETEYEVFRKFKKITRGRTSIIISHRLSTVRMADRIFVLDRSRIVESGTHDELCEMGGQYANMFKLQAENYH